MKIYAVIAGNHGQAKDYLQRLCSESQVFNKAELTVTDKERSFQYRYIPDIERARGLELAGIEQIGNWYTRWTVGDYERLSAMIRP